MTKLRFCVVFKMWSPISLILLCQATMANDGNHADITTKPHFFLNTRCFILSPSSILPRLTEFFVISCLLLGLVLLKILDVVNWILEIKNGPVMHIIELCYSGQPWPCNETGNSRSLYLNRLCDIHSLTRAYCTSFRTSLHWWAYNMYY